MVFKGIIIHWTAGGYIICDEDKEHYHFIVDRDGNVVNGKYKPEDNLDTSDGNYAAHVGGGNTGRIGISMAAMRGFVNKNHPGDRPITLKQFLATVKKVALLCKQYNIPVNEDTVMTHYEFGKKHPETSSAGKIDIVYLPPYPTLKDYEIGNFIRNKVREYLSDLV